MDEASEIYGTANSQQINLCVKGVKAANANIFPCQINGEIEVNILLVWALLAPEKKFSNKLR